MAADKLADLVSKAKINCPVVACSGWARDHKSPNPAENLHSVDEGEWDLPLEAYPVMDSTTWPHWHVYLDLYNKTDPTPTKALKIAAGIIQVALLAIDLNAAVDDAEEAN